MSLIVKHVAIVKTELITNRPTVYSSDLKLIGSSYELMVSIEKEKNILVRRDFSKIGVFEIEPIGSLRRDGLHQNKLEIDSQTLVRQVRNNLLNPNYSSVSNPLDDVIVFPKWEALLYGIDNTSTVALFAEPFPKAWFYDSVRDLYNARKN